MYLKERSFGLRYVITVGLIVLLLLWLAARTFGQTSSASGNQPSVITIRAAEKTDTPHPVFFNHKVVKIGVQPVTGPPFSGIKQYF